MTAKWQNLLVCLAILLATAGIYAQTAGFEFIDLDDALYVQNRHVLQGLSVESLQWAAISTENSNWLPLTRISHIVDHSLYGDRSGPVHVENAVLHAIASLMVFWFLYRATGERWPSAFVGLLFAVHPSHVESVAWVAERKDVLCAVFWFLTLWSWVLYTARPSRWRYLRTLLFFCLGLMSKPMMVSLPVILLLLDWWPLRRPFSRQILVEKIPFAALSLAVCIVTFLAQKATGAVQTFERVSPLLRVENSLLTWLVYPMKTVWPSGLAAYYPYPKELSAWVLLCGLAIVGISALAFRVRRRFPWLATGWFWYLVTTLPVIGLVQVGLQSRADRYMYIPMVGLAIPVAWGVARLIAWRPSARPFVAATAMATLAAFSALAWQQTGYWTNSETLFRRTLAVTTGNFTAWLCLGGALATGNDRLPDALGAYREAVRVRPESADARTKVAEVLERMGRIPEAQHEIETALKYDPQYWPALDRRGVLLGRQGKAAEAISVLRSVTQAQPEQARPHADLGAALGLAGLVDEAMREDEQALRLNPELSVAHSNLGGLLMKTGQPEAAVSEFEAAVKTDPGSAPAHLLLAEAQFRLGRSVEGIGELEAALEIDPGDAGAQFRLAGLLAGLGRTEEALQHARAAVRIAPDPASAKMVKDLESRMQSGH